MIKIILLYPSNFGWCQCGYVRINFDQSVFRINPHLCENDLAVAELVSSVIIRDDVSLLWLEFSSSDGTKLYRIGNKFIGTVDTQARSSVDDDVRGSIFGCRYTRDRSSARGPSTAFNRQLSFGEEQKHPSAEHRVLFSWAITIMILDFVLWHFGVTN